MFKTILKNSDKARISQASGKFLLVKSNRYLSALQKKLSKQIDQRYVRTFFDLFVAILLFRNRSMGLLLSELGGFICGFDRAPAGTKRISNLLRCKGWTHDLIDKFFFQRGKERISQLLGAGKRPLMLWDDSRIEKPESWFLQGLCSVFSSKGQRLTKVKRGFYRPPVSRICVPGYKWTGTTLSALGNIPSVFQMSWWTTRGIHKEVGTNFIFRLLQQLDQQIGRAVLHVMDRGYANADIIEWMLQFNQDFLLRWKKNHLLINEKGQSKKTHLISRSYRARASKLVSDKERKKHKRITIAWATVKHPLFLDNDLSLVIVRDKNNHNSPMYLLTNLKIEDAAQAWEICFSYIHRWHIEQSFRCCKSELAMESPRLWFFKNTLKLLAIVTLVYDFLLKLLRHWKGWTAQLMRNWAHRTGNRYRKAAIPIYRLRNAISNALMALFYHHLDIFKLEKHEPHVQIVLTG